MILTYCPAGYPDTRTYRHTEANMSGLKAPAAHLAMISQDEEESFVKTDREGSKNEVFLNRRIPIEREAMLLLQTFPSVFLSSPHKADILTCMGFLSLAIFYNCIYTESVQTLHHYSLNDMTIE